MLLVTFNELNKELSKIYSYDEFRIMFHKLSKDYYSINLRLRYNSENFLEIIKQAAEQDIHNHFGKHHDWICVYEILATYTVGGRIRIQYFEGSSLKDIKDYIKIYNKLMVFV